jgi:hypothetical protein
VNGRASGAISAYIPARLIAPFGKFIQAAEYSAKLVRQWSALV